MQSNLVSGGFEPRYKEEIFSQNTINQLTDLSNFLGEKSTGKVSKNEDDKLLEGIMIAGKMEYVDKLMTYLQ